MKTNFSSFFHLKPKEQIVYMDNLCNTIVSQMKKKEVNIEEYVSLISQYKTLTSVLYRVSGVYKKEYFDFICRSIRLLWSAVENCSSQILLYPALSAFAEIFAKLKGLNPYYTLTDCINETISFSSLPSRELLRKSLLKEKQHLSFLLDYFQLESVLRFIESEKDKLHIIKSATNFAQILILSVYNFLITIPVISRKDFIEWTKLFETAIEKAISTHKLLLKKEFSEGGKFNTVLSESSLHSLRTQLFLLKCRFLNENIQELLNLASLEASSALNDLEPYLGKSDFTEQIQIFYNQQKALLLETRFYQLFSNYVQTQFRSNKYIGDIKDEKRKLTISTLKLQVQTILEEIQESIEELAEVNKDEYIGISSNLINVYVKIAFAAYVYDLTDETNTMEKMIKTRRLDIGDPELSLLLGRYWLLRWNDTGDNKLLRLSETYFNRAAEIYEIVFNNKKVPIYAHSITGNILLHLNIIPKAEVFFMKADDAFNDAKALNILNQSEIYFYEQFREQIDLVLRDNELVKPLRFTKPFNVLDFNTWIQEKKDWRKKMALLPEPFPFHLDQLKILEFEFIHPSAN